MPSATIPCPVCSTRLILDDGNAGTTVVCPGCQETLKFPETVSPESQAVPVPRDAPAPPQKGVHRLNRSRTSVDEESSPAADADSPAAKRVRHLPSRRRTEEDEARRLAAMGAADREVDFDLHRFEKRGMTHFTCPGCHRPHWIRSGDAGSVIVCSGCGQEVITPTDDSPARLVEAPDLNPPESRKKTILPVRRRVENEQLDERAAPPRHEDRSDDNPEAAPTEESEDHPPILPIPAKGDVVLQPGVLPSSRATARRKAKEPPPPEEPEPVAPVPVDPPNSAEPAVRGGFRLGSDTRELQFSPKVEDVVDMETSAGWGGSAEFHPRTKRLLIISLLACALIVASLVTWFLRNRFLEAAPDPGLSSSNPMENVEAARPVLDRFFAATTIDELAEVVRHPEITRPRMELFYARNPLKARRIVGEDGQWHETTAGTTDFITGRVTTDNARAFDVALEIQPGKVLKVDWEFVHNWAEIPWQEFLKTPGDDAVDFRVTATTDRNYDYFFKDRELDYFCFKLVDPMDDMSTWGYCHKDSPAALALIDSMRRARQTGQVDEKTGEPYSKCILRLRFSPEGRKTNQVMIEGYVNDNWIVP